MKEGATHATSLNLDNCFPIVYLLIAVIFSMRAMRTLTILLTWHHSHELGHYLGLHHVLHGDGEMDDSYIDSDYCEDTYNRIEYSFLKNCLAATMTLNSVM